jgi:cell division protein FtsL
MPVSMRRERADNRDAKKGYIEYLDPDVDQLIYEVSDDLITREEVARKTEQYDKSHGAPESKKTERARKKKIRYKMRSRVFEYGISIGLIILVGMFVGLLLYPQQQLSEISRDNSDLKDEIAVLKRNVIDSEENLNGIMDMETLRAQALALGMQDPNSNQVVTIPMPVDDKLVTVVTYDSYGINEDAYNNALDNLSSYYLRQISK